MSFSYDFVNSPDVAKVRLLVSDTVNVAPLPIWQDEEINGALQLFSSQNIIVGLSGYSPSVPVAQVFSHRRSAAALLRALAANKGRMTVAGLLDARLNAQQASQALNKIADDYILSEENDGFFAVAEMVNDAFSMRERLWKQLYRIGT